ncbi:MAG: effector binding domain-containing protein, partial [Fibrobacter sp.]|nr:effector binding domain-containing protein [Fibrobacter sp.]
NVLSLRRILPDYYAEKILWQELSSFAKQNRLSISDASFSIYHDTEYKETDVDVEVCVPVEHSGNNMGEFVYRTVEPVALMASTMVYGDFSNIAKAYTAFAEWLQKNTHYKMTGSTRQIVHRGPWNENNPQKYLIELQIPLEHS